MSSPPQPIVFNSAQIQSAVAGVANEIAGWLLSKKHSKLNLISVMEGAKPFTRDLLAGLQKIVPKIQVQVHEIRIKGTDGKSLLETRELREGQLDPAVLGSGPILIVDDLVDSGKTLKMLKEKVAALSALEVKTAVLVRKFGDASGQVDFLGFDLNLDRVALAQKGLKDYWLFGYGMDINGRNRNYEYIAWIEMRLGG